MFSVLSIVAIVLTMVVGVSGTVLCIASDHTAIETAQAGNCTPCPDMPAGKTESPVGRNADSSGCGSCVDIPLSGAMTSQVAPARHASTLKVLVSAMPANADSTAMSDLVLANSFRSEECANSALRVVSTTILRI